MEKRALEKLVYGLFVLTAKLDGNDNGCIINTVLQVANNPDMICVAVNRGCYTHDMILATGEFNLSILSQESEFEVYRRFGLQSGREVDKFADFTHWKRSENGLSYLTQGTNAFLSAKVERFVALGTHTVFIGKITEEGNLSQVPSVTYDYYYENIKQPITQNSAVMEEEDQATEVQKAIAEGKTVWKCKICGYEYIGDQLPEDYICPICKHPSSDFEKISPME